MGRCMAGKETRGTTVIGACVPLWYHGYLSLRISLIPRLSSRSRESLGMRLMWTTSLVPWVSFSEN